MSSKSRNFRRRGGDNDGDDETTTAPKPPPPSTATKPKKKSLLSFADDEEEEDSRTPFTTRPVSKPAPNSSTRKSSSTSSGSHHKLVSSKDRFTPTTTPKSSSNVQPQAGTYTKEALLELQKNTKTLAPRSRSSARPEHKPEPKPGLVEPVIVLKGLVKPVGSGGNERRDSESENEVEREAISKLGSLGVEEIGGGGIIPDRATIEAIRAKRERLRQVRAAAPDYIALDEGGNHGEAEGLSDEEPEFQGRIGFYGEKIDKRGVFEDFEDKVMEKEASGVVVESYGSEDEEDKMWEEEQVRKGLGKRMDDGGSNRGGVTSVSAPPIVVQSSVEKVKFGNSASMYSSVQSVAHTIGGAVGGLPNLDVMSISQKADLAKKALLQNMGRLKESHGRTVASLCKTEENLAASLSNVTALEISLSAAGEKYIFMQKLRDFVSVICAFLQDKAPYIEELEDQVLELHKERAAAIVERRAADNNDEMKELEAAVSAARQVFNKSSNVATIEAATAAALAATAAMRKGGDLPVELDEFGRDKNLQNRMDMSRRAEARKRRRVKNDVKRVSAIRQDNAYQSIEGESSTDESDSESNAYQSNCDQLLQVAEQIFGDTHEEYSQLSVVMEKFDTWKKEYASSYRDAYMSLTIPSIFSPYVRLELLKWDPLHGKNADFTKMEWYELLYNYGLPKDKNEISPDDADANLVPELVEKLAIPILHNHLTYCWDMLSTRETQCAVSAIKLVLTFGPFEGPAISNLAALIRDRLADAVANLTVPTWDSLVLKAVPDAARVAAYRFGMSIRLMRNICLLHGILATPILEKLALDELLSGKVLPHLRSIQANSHDALMRTERVVASLNGVWTGPSVTGICSPKLRPLVDYLLKLGRGLEKEHVSGSGESKTAKFARRLKRMLVELNEYDHARDISRTFNLKEAL